MAIDFFSFLIVLCCCCSCLLHRALVQEEGDLRDVSVRHCIKTQFWLDHWVHHRAIKMGLRGASRCHVQPWSCTNFLRSWVTSPWGGLLWKLKSETEPWSLSCCAVVAVLGEKLRNRTCPRFGDCPVRLSMGRVWKTVCHIGRLRA